MELSKTSLSMTAIYSKERPVASHAALSEKPFYKKSMEEASPATLGVTKHMPWHNQIFIGQKCGKRFPN
jgi:hypothetical protein